jgi:hypothetical protein
MEAKVIEMISSSIQRQFPEFAGTKPKVRLQAESKTGVNSKAPTYLLTYESKVQVAEGKTLARWVRVIATGEGKIIKVTTSR